MSRGAHTQGRSLWDMLSPVHRLVRALPELTPPPEFPDRLQPIDPSLTTIDNAVYDEEGVADGWHGGDADQLASLQLLNPARVPFFLRAFRAQLRTGAEAPRLLDIGCGGGLVTEELARAGYTIVGLDMSEKAVAYARARAEDQGLSTASYEVGDAYDLSRFADASFDGVVMSDVLEHLHDLPRAVGGVARVLAPGGVFAFDTINRTVLSYVLTIALAQEALRVVPANTHDWRMYVRPEELSLLLQRTGFEVDTAHFVGMKPGVDPRRLFRGRVPLGDFWEAPGALRVNYLGWARRS
eukprot:CAMPEP_0206014270 /NCGR_PEP_ID=MMETSP1464-20131121/17995_1 /ASSEMBLY_ACC=CAM_ASM_001124 /TAXON_ID=119497 /ORGANISM="Exanthemachrysis gayraliae, Strain RCC1523" /LENGTH=296 /DNA_ID=CAMNT_0053388015 /DNA_START=1 /DNA_END=891 /DNA_ORIENTATION=+